MKVGACAYCGQGPLTTGHSCLQMRAATSAKEGFPEGLDLDVNVNYRVEGDKFVTDKDIVEEAKECLEYYPSDDPEFPVGLVKRLVQEVEKLRKENAELKETIEAIGSVGVRQEEEIKDLKVKAEKILKALRQKEHDLCAVAGMEKYLILSKMEDFEEEPADPYAELRKIRSGTCTKCGNNISKDCPVDDNLVWVDGKLYCHNGACPPEAYKWRFVS